MTAARERREHARIRSTISVPRCARFAAVRRGGAKARDRFLASDPGLIRLFSAVSTVGGVLLTLLVLGLSGAPARVVLVGAMGAMAAGATVSDPRPGGKAITLAAAVPVGLLALSLGTVLAPHRVIADFALLLLIFTVVFVRRYGRRCDALGGIAFQFFFTAQFAHARPEQLPVLCSVVVLAIGSSAVVLLCLIRDTPERALRRLRHSFRARLAAAVDAMIAVAEAESGATATTALHRNTARLHQCALMIQSRLDTANVNPLVQRRIAEAETAAERLGMLLSRNGSTPDPGLAAELRVLRLLLSQPHGLTPGTSPAGELRECHRALGELTRASVRLRHAFGTATEEPGDQPAREETAAEMPSGLRHPGTRAAVQVTIGSAVAILGGELLSTQRWYWAMLACWVVYINTSSVGEVLLKGYRRLAGTFAGAFAGIGLAALVAGHVWTTFALVILGLFGAFYLAAVSYLLMSLLITTMVGLLYTLLGTYSDAVLVLRIEETALGAASGLLAALLVLPQRTQRRTDEQLTEVLHRMRAFLGQACARPAGTSPGQLLDAARAVDTELDAFRASAQPLIHPASPLRGRRSRARQLLGLLETSAYHARSLATTAAEDPRLAETGKSLAHNLSTVAELVRGDHASHAGDAASVARHARELEENVLCRSGSPRPVEVAVSHRPRPVTPRRPPGSAASRALPAGAPGTARGSRSSGSARSRAS